MTEINLKPFHEISDIIAKQGETNAAQLVSFAEFLKKSSFNNIIMVGHGSQLFTCYYAKYLFELALGIPVAIAVSPPITASYNHKFNYQQSLIFVCSPSGVTPEITQYISEAKNAKATIICLTNDEKSVIAELSDFIFNLQSSPTEDAISSKSFLATLYAIASLYAMFCGDNEIANELYHLPDTLDQVINTQWDLFNNHLISCDKLITLGTNFNMAAALETSLKFNQLTQIFSFAYNEFEFTNFPLTSLIEKNIPVLQLIINDSSYKSSLLLQKKLKESGVSVFAIESDSKNDWTLTLPRTSPISQTIIQTTAIYNIIDTIMIQKKITIDSKHFINTFNPI